MPKFVPSTITGVNMKCKIAFAKNYFTKNFADVDKRIYFDLGIIAEIGWNNITNVTPKFTLNTTNPFDITSGVSMVRGQAVFKIFHRDSLEALKHEIGKGINDGADKIVFPLIQDNPFDTLENYEDSLLLPSHTDADIMEWGEMPLFDIILITEAKDENYSSHVLKKEIKGCRFERIGFSEGIDSLEINTIAQFMAIGEITDWEEVAKTYGKHE